MQTAEEYLSKTESAVRKLFDGVDSYTTLLRRHPNAVFVSDKPPGPALDAEFEAWSRTYASDIRASLQTQRDYFAETFAIDTLCGAILQVATKAIECYSENTHVPPDWCGTVKPPLAKYCIGRLVRTVPLGLVLYAARNQHTHFNEEQLREPNVAVFERLATEHRYGAGIIDPAFDLRNVGLPSYASNVTALVGWRSFASYQQDMLALVGPASGRLDVKSPNRHT